MTDLLNGQLTIEKAQRAITNPFNEKEHKQMTFEEVLPQIKRKKAVRKGWSGFELLLNYVMKLAPPKVVYKLPRIFNQNF